MLPLSAHAADGLTVSVYNMLGYNNAPPTPTEDKKVYETVVPNIDFQWGSGGIFTNFTEDVIVKFEGTITSPVTGDVIFYAPADDGVKLYIDGVDVINDWYDKGGGGSQSQPVSFTANVPKSITLWYYENGGGAWVQLNWQLPGAGMTVVPSSAFIYIDPAIEAARLEAERQATLAEQARLAELERQRLAAIEAARIAAEQETARQAAIAAELERQRLAAIAAEAERQRIAAEQEAARQASVAAQKAYEAEVAHVAAIEAEKQRVAAAQKAEEERIASITAAIEAEAKRVAEEEAKQKAEEEALIKWLEEKRIAFEEAEAKAKAEELARLLEEERIAKELKAKLEEESRVAAEAQAKAEAEAKAAADEAARIEAERIEAERKAAELATQVKPTPSPEPTSVPTPIPSPGISTEPSQTPVVIEPSPTTIPEVTIPEPVEPSPVSTPEPEVIVLDEETNLEELAPETPIELENGVILTAETVIAIQLLQDPAEFIAEMFTDPIAALSALGSVGADMTPEAREKSEKVVIAAVIAGNIATQAAASAGAVAAYRRKP